MFYIEILLIFFMLLLLLLLLLTYKFLPDYHANEHANGMGTTEYLPNRHFVRIWQGLPGWFRYTAQPPGAERHPQGLRQVQATGYLHHIFSCIKRGKNMMQVPLFSIFSRLNLREKIEKKVSLEKNPWGFFSSLTEESPLPTDAPAPPIEWGGCAIHQSGEKFWRIFLKNFYEKFPIFFLKIF